LNHRITQENPVTELTIQDLITKLTASFLPEKAVGVNTAFQLSLTGEQGGEWGVVIKDQACSVLAGALPEPRLTIKADTQDVLDIFTGKMDGSAAFMQGKIKLKGDMGLLFRLANYFKTS
jgi:putative sterol carrier protein